MGLPTNTSTGGSRHQSMHSGEATCCSNPSRPTRLAEAKTHTSYPSKAKRRDA